jgi:hypothetical protein
MKHRGVEGGTIYGEPLCRTCHHSIYIKGKAEGQEMLMCESIGFMLKAPLPFEAYECSSYSDKRLPSLHDMEKTAWIIQSDAINNKIGFVSPKHKEAHRKALGRDDD